MDKGVIKGFMTFMQRHISWKKPKKIKKSLECEGKLCYNIGVIPVNIIKYQVGGSL